MNRDRNAAALRQEVLEGLGTVAADAASTFFQSLALTNEGSGNARSAMNGASQKSPVQREDAPEQSTSVASSGSASRRAHVSDAELRLLDGDALSLDVLQVEGHARLGALFEYEIHVGVETPELFEETQLAGQRAALIVTDNAGRERRIRGLIAAVQMIGCGSQLAYFALTLVPSLWKLTQRQNCRVFQELTTWQIIDRVLEDHGLVNRVDHFFACNGTYEPRDYCVQYRESDFDFISRLMEEEGIYFFYRERDGETLLHLTDGPHGHFCAAFGREARFVAPEGRTPELGTIHHLRSGGRVRPGRVTLTDYAARRPSLPLVTGAIDNPRDGEIFDYPGEYRDSTLGQRLATVRLQEARVGRMTIMGRCTRVDFAPGHRFALTGHPISRLDGEYLITSVTQRIRTPMADELGYVPDGESTAREYRPAFEAEFEAIPAEQVFRPARNTPRPRVGGPQTAVVVGPDSEEIYTDKYGRVKVRFRWDRGQQLSRDARKESDSSCWIRVSQPWAGVSYGGLTIPRIGQEVIVEFLEGDPDQPIITGRVYNGEAMQPTSMAAPTRMTGKGPEPIPAMQDRPQLLPDSATRTTIRTNSTPGGGGANELTLDDAAGRELFHLHATKDFVFTIGDFSTTTVGNDMKLSVGNCLFEFVAISHDVFIGINETQFIGCCRAEVVGCNETITIGMNRTEAVGMNETLSVGLNRTEVIGVDHTEAIGHDMNLKVGNDIKIVAGNSITIETGKSQIYMHKDGTITIRGKEIAIEASTSLTELSPITTIDGTTNMTMRGASTLIQGVKMHVMADDLLHMESANKLDSVAAGENVIQGKPIKMN